MIIRKKLSFELKKNISLKHVLAWTSGFETFHILHSNAEEQDQQDQYHCFDILIAAGSIENMADGQDFFPALKKFREGKNDWLFGYFSYDLKNQVEKLSSENFDGINAPDYFFFVPRYVIEISGKNISVNYLPDVDDELSVKLIIDSLCESSLKVSLTEISAVKSRINSEQYKESVNKLKEHIRRGDIYEANFCMEFYSENTFVDPCALYLMLNRLSPMPFSGYFRNKEIHVLCASPERFLSKRKDKIISQPIKGTAARGKSDDEDVIIKDRLRNDSKEQSENVMIVDLVRNDLSRNAARGSVVVEELFGIKTFKNLFHMVSTVTSVMNENRDLTDVIRDCFPMGSMTGAPKIRAMQLIEEYEETKRGIYSGTMGYITPSGDFDLNVIIRTIIYNSESNYLSFMAGSAITDGSDPEKEYEECLLKAAAMKNVIESSANITLQK